MNIYGRSLSFSRTHRIRALELLLRSRYRSPLWAHRSARSPRQLSPFTLMGNPPPQPPYAQVGCLPKATGRSGLKFEKLCVETPNRAVYTFVLGHLSGRDRGAIHPAEALRLPPVVEIATFSLTQVLWPFATACIHHWFFQAHNEMLCFFTTAVQPLDTFLDLYSIGRVVHPRPSSNRGGLPLPVPRNHLPNMRRSRWSADTNFPPQASFHHSTVKIRP